MDETHKELVKRLRAHFRSVNASGVPCMTARNPDGEEAALALEGLAGEVERVTKELDVSWAKRKIWINGFNEQSALAASAEAERDRLKAALDIAKDHAKQNQRARDLVSPYPNDHAKRIVWEKALYHEGKGLWAKLRKALGDAS